MLDSVKEILTKEIDLHDVLDKEIDTKHLKKFLAQEIEIKKLKELLATEIKLKEFLVQEIDVKKMFSTHEQAKIDKEEAEYKSINKAVSDNNLKMLDAGSKKAEAAKENTEENKHKNAEANAVPSPKKLPPYDYSLIKTLEEEQAELLFVYKEMMKHAEAEQYSAAAGRLEAFSSKIKAHFHKADKELYSYLRTFIQLKYPKRERAFNELNLEMKNISIEIFFSITQSPHIPVNERNRSEFIKEFTHLGKLLETRIHREETVLHVMYDESNGPTDIS
ncbi:hypothetical protein GCM10009133_03270 [Cocleimonas flava]|uniref:Hemerythrin HHE cation binding domain-containing protein n=1 Tax=Cocleimonas flava TaxID=634765 RepID=A0A4R1EZE8_9GAMM|nr:MULTISPECIES: hypothetical protein [Cocleimonas]MEB8433652.1 hypothetical protein [Cocleimonas sp. KMM 6892]MEC4716463.1 hypothetical protein [Cocleimonas sp. KMM 6895]MEC4745644.1 hypothetical protein [Cocleimonas sp. KMM 6896]TCJ85299.1 hypothetical protein EV695_3269 [Cocleimonas flava]